MTAFIFSSTYHISFGDAFPELISDLFLLLNPNLNSNLDLCMILKQDVQENISFPTYLFLPRERGKFTLIHIYAAPKWLKCLVCFFRKTFWTQKRKDREERTTEKILFPSPFLVLILALKKYAKPTKQKDTAVITGQY